MKSGLCFLLYVNDQTNKQTNRQTYRHADCNTSHPYHERSDNVWRVWQTSKTVMPRFPKHLNPAITRQRNGNVLTLMVRLSGDGGISVKTNGEFANLTRESERWRRRSSFPFPSRAGWGLSGVVELNESFSLDGATYNDNNIRCNRFVPASSRSCCRHRVNLDATSNTFISCNRCGNRCTNWLLRPR